MSLRKAIRKRLALQSELDELTRKYEAAKAPLEAGIADCRRQEREFRAGLDAEKMELGRSILDIHGNPYGMTDGCGSRDNTIAECAIRDILGGCAHLRERYFGNKRYDMFYQRSDARYGWCPTYGGIVDSVGLKEAFRESGAALTPEQEEAAIYYIRNCNAAAETTV